MKCIVCKQGETRPEPVSEFLERDGHSVIVRNVPAEVCQNCGEVYLGADVVARLFEIAEEAIGRGEEVVVQQYIVA